jgi:hypothetical protein
VLLPCHSILYNKQLLQVKPHTSIDDLGRLGQGSGLDQISAVACTEAHFFCYCPRQCARHSCAAAAACHLISTDLHFVLRQLKAFLAAIKNTSASQVYNGHVLDNCESGYWNATVLDGSP